MKTKSNAMGEFELAVPPGKYQVSFHACVPRNCMAPPTVNQTVTVRSKEETKVFFHCAGSNP